MSHNKQIFPARGGSLYANSYKARMVSCKDIDCIQELWTFHERLRYEGLLFQINQQSCRTHTYWPNRWLRGAFPWASLLGWLRWLP